MTLFFPTRLSSDIIAARAAGKARTRPWAEARSISPGQRNTIRSGWSRNRQEPKTATHRRRDARQRHRLNELPLTARPGISAARAIDRGPHVVLAGPARAHEVRARVVQDRKSVVKGKSVSVRVELGGRRILIKKKTRSMCWSPKQYT